MGMAYKMALDFDKAAAMFRTVLDLNKDFTGEANAEWAVIQKIQRAAPGTEIGKKIALIDKIDRADIAALFDQEMNLEKLFTKRGVKTYDTSFKAPTESIDADLAGNDGEDGAGYGHQGPLAQAEHRYDPEAPGARTRGRPEPQIRSGQAHHQGRVRASCSRTS